MLVHEEVAEARPFLTVTFTLRRSQSSREQRARAVSLDTSSRLNWWADVGCQNAGGSVRRIGVCVLG